MPAALSSNVITLESWRRRAMRCKPARVYYVTEHAHALDQLEALPSVDVFVICTAETLQFRLATERPDLIVVEAGLGWIDGIEVVSYAHTELAVPVVYLYEAQDLRRQPLLLKQAFAAGAHDTLRAPLNVDELHETLSVLLKFQRQRLKAP